jgi:osmotically-inducible protein OsmY
VKDVKNFLLIGMNSSLKSKASDVITTSNVISRLYFNESNFESKLSPLHVKVVTERQEVYLMGILNAKEADDAIEIAKSSKGVKKVIPLFEINDNYQNTY